eukprot:RCo016868
MSSTSRLSRVTVKLQPAARSVGAKPHRHVKQWQMPETAFLKEVFSEPIFAEQKINDRFTSANMGPTRIDIRRAVPPIVVPKRFKYAWCDGNWADSPTHGHPRMTIRMRAGMVAQCKYCENKFVREDFDLFTAKREAEDAEEKYHAED